MLLFSNSEKNILDSGLLYGKNYYLPHLLTYSFPGFSPRRGIKNQITTAFTYYGINEFLLYNKSQVALDYESSILESSYTYRLFDNFLVGTDIRFVSYYEGFMDPIINIWHNLLNVPDAGRNLYSNSQLAIFIDNSEGENPTLIKKGIFLGDTDLYSVWNIKENSAFSIAIASALKIPTGSFKYLTSSGFIDFGIQVLGEYYISNRWVLGLQQGFVIPGDVILKKNTSYASRIQSQTFSSIQFYPKNDIGIISQFRINTSPISSERKKTSNLVTNYTFFTLPQTSIIIGIKKYFGSFLTQLSIEEDLLTYEGVDILFTFRVIKAL